MSIWNSYKFDLTSTEPAIVIEEFKAILKTLNIDAPLEIIFDTNCKNGLLKAQQLFGNQLNNLSFDIGGKGRSESYPTIVKGLLPFLNSIQKPRTSFNVTFFSINKDYTLSAGFLHNEYWTPSIYLSFMEYGERAKFRSIRSLRPKYYQQALDRLNLSEDFYKILLEINNQSISGFYQKCMVAAGISMQFSINEKDKLIIDEKEIPSDYVARKLGFSSFHLIPNSQSIEDAMGLLSKILENIDLLVSEYRFAFSANFENTMKINEIEGLYQNEVSFRNSTILQCPAIILEQLKMKQLPGTMTVTVPFTPPKLLYNEDATSEISLFLSPEKAEIEVDISSSEHYELIIEDLEKQTGKTLNWFAAL